MNNKYAFKDGQILNLATHKPIPAGEPVFVLRAQDKVAHIALAVYLQALPDNDHKHAVEAAFADFKAWAYANPAAMKAPDTHIPHSMITSWEFKSSDRENEVGVVIDVLPSVGSQASYLESAGCSFHIKQHNLGLALQIETGNTERPNSFSIVSRDNKAALGAAADRLIRAAFNALETELRHGH